jgi:RIO-like serine/threonine protein kinase
LGQRQLAQLRTVFDQPPSHSHAVLAGRQSITMMQLHNIGPVAVKHYARGGLVRYVNRRTYVHWPQTRGEREFRWLETVRRIGIAAPQPIAFASTGHYLGQCWLITAVIPGHRSLIQAEHDGDLQEAVYGQVAAQIRALIDQGIWHRDLHPGNVLVDEKDRPHLIDFDKARYLNNRRLLKARYVNRWKRAIAKHHLAPKLVRVMALATIDPCAADRQHPYGFGRRQGKTNRN